MDDQKLKTKIHDTLKSTFKENSLVDVSNGFEDCIHVVVVSRKFDRFDVSKNIDRIWNVLQKKLTPDEWGKITLVMGTNPEAIKAM